MPALTNAAHWIVLGLFVLVLAIAAVSDVRSRRIPNWTVLAIVALFAGWIFVEPSASIVSSLEAAAIVLLVSGTLYVFNLLGAGDSKFLTAIALFVGLKHLPQLGLITVLAGGALAVVSLAASPTRALVLLQTRSSDGSKRGIPYGLAIAVAGALTVFGVGLSLS